MQNGKQLANVGRHVTESRTLHNGIMMTAASAVLELALLSPLASVKRYGSIKLLSDASAVPPGDGDEKRFLEKRNELTRITVVLHVKPARAVSGKKRTLCVVNALLSASSSARCF